MLSFLLPLWEWSLISKDLDSLLMVQEKWHCQSYFCTETLIGCETCLWWPCQQNLGRQNTEAYVLISLKTPIPRNLGVLSRCKWASWAPGIMKKALALLLAQRSAHPSPARWGEVSPVLQPRARERCTGEQAGTLAAGPSCRVVCWSFFICCGVCTVGACILGPGLNRVSGWVLVCCRYLVRTRGLSGVFFPCWPLKETVCPHVPCHSMVLLIET